MSLPQVNEDLLDDELTPPVILKLGKREYRLAFSMASVLAFKKVTGRNFFTPEGWEGFSLKEDPESIVAFFWAALQTYHSDISLERAARIANFGNMPLISQKCNEALQTYLPKQDADVGEEKPTTEAPMSIGLTSGV
jgi:hypothetical protein